jgi:hypothetical protein
MDANPFLAQFMKAQAHKLPVLQKVTTTGNNLTQSRKGIREFAKSKPSGKDVEKWFKAKIAELEMSD